MISRVSDARIPILYLAPWVDLGGSDKGTIDWFKHIDRSRWAPSLITTQPSPNRWLQHIESFAEEIWDLPDLMPGGSFPEFILGFIESRGVRLVHIMNSRLGFDLLPDMACLPEPPAVVVQMHAEEPNQSGYVRYATRRYGNLIDTFSVTSEHLKAAVVGYEIPPSRVEVIYSGVDSKEEFNPEYVKPLGLKGSGTPRILWPGRLVEQKDPMLTLDVLAHARERGAKFVLDIVGDGHMESALHARAEELGVADIIQWHSPSQEMARWYRSTDLLLMTSVFEGVPYVIYESLAMGVPVVAPALPGNVEFMDDDSGALIEPRSDAIKYAEAIVDLLDNEEQRRAMGERSRNRMLTEFSLSAMGEHHDELYERLLARRPASSRWRSDELFGGEEVGFDQAPAVASAPLTLPRSALPERTIGVIVPCYRHGIFLDECIRSIKAQTLAPTRVIVVDDGSDDLETLEALERLEGDPDLTILRQPTNAGPSAARNRALKALDTSYVLPIDADDQLLPDALERMLAQLEAAPEDTGFIYPHAQHIGNRSDFVRLPAYNLWLLMEENYCPAPALFDRRVFEGAGVAYPEEIVVGHEDWDLILQLAERGIRGIHADGPTFLYRRQGFSRVNAVDYGPHTFHDAITHRHPALYLNRDSIKAHWAPALSIVLLDGEEAWSSANLSGLKQQTCKDFEVLASAAMAEGVQTVAAEANSSAAWLQAAIGQARGPWVCMLTTAVAALLHRHSFVEQLLHSFTAEVDMSAIVLGDAPGITRHAFSKLDDRERLSAQPVGVAFKRETGIQLPKIDLESNDTILVDLAVGLQADGPVQWRFAPLADRGSGSRSASADGEEHSLQLDLNFARGGDKSETAMLHSAARQTPRLPELTPGTVRRWEDAPGWTPPETHPLCRHIGLNGEGRIVSNDRKSPPGYKLEFDLGVVREAPTLGTRRLIHTNHTFELSDDQNELPPDRHGLGYVEDQPFPLLELLELRRMPGGDERVLVAGPDDPLFDVAEPEATLGWIEASPILPRGILQPGPWGVTSLRRHIDHGVWRHRYSTASPGHESDAVSLGSLFPRPGAELVALCLRDDSRLATDLTRPGRASRDPRKIGHWVAAPLRSSEHISHASTKLHAGGRLRHLALHYDARKLGQEGGETLGWLRREDAPGCTALFSTTHPITGDQLVTRSAQQAIDIGYLVDGVLGFILDTGADSTPDSKPYAVPWAPAAPA